MVTNIMGEQIDKAMQFFENEIEQYKIILKGVISNDYKEYIEKKISYYSLALSAIKTTREIGDDLK